MGSCSFDFSGAAVVAGVIVRVDDDSGSCRCRCCCCCCCCCCCIAVWCSVPSFTAVAVAALAGAAAAVDHVHVIVDGKHARVDKINRIWKAIIVIVMSECCACACTCDAAGVGGVGLGRSLPLDSKCVVLLHYLFTSRMPGCSWHSIVAVYHPGSILALALLCESVIESVLSADQPTDPVIAIVASLVFLRVLLILNVNAFAIQLSEGSQLGFAAPSHRVCRDSLRFSRMTHSLVVSTVIIVLLLARASFPIDSHFVSLAAAAAAGWW